MRVLRTAWLALTVAALASGTSVRVAAQADTTRRATSERRIPVRKDGRAVQESRGEVALAGMARINSLEEMAATLQQRLQALESERASLVERADANALKITSLESALARARQDLFSARYALALETARARNLESTIAQFDRNLSSLRHGSLFGNSGFYVALGTGVNFTTGTLHGVGYGTGLHVVMPVGWSKRGYVLGVRAEFAAQSLEGNVRPGFVNTDPVAYSANVMLTVNLPINRARTNLLYLMGGGGVFVFDHVGSASALADRLDDTGGTAKQAGLTAGAGLEFHVLGATSLFVQTAITNVYGERPVATGGKDRNLRWVPLVAGITLR